jgi:hypothetical protein
VVPKAGGSNPLDHPITHPDDLAVVGDAVAVVGQRRRVEERQPDDVDAQPGQVVQVLVHADEVADRPLLALIARLISGS